MVATFAQFLVGIPRFFFDDHESTGVSTTSTHDLVRASGIISDIAEHLDKAILMLKEVQLHDRSKNLSWYFDGRDRVNEMLGDLVRFDSIMATNLSLIENSNSTQTSGFISKIEATNDKLLDAKQQLLKYKKYTDLAVAYREMSVEIIGGIVDEIDQCARIVQRLSHTKISDNFMVKLSISELAEKLKLMDLTRPSELLLHLDHASIYHDFRSLESKAEPLHASIDFLPYKMEEFERICSGYVIKAEEEVEDIRRSLQRLQRQYNLLQESINCEKHRLVEKQWHAIFARVLEVVSYETRELCSLHKSQVPASNEFGSKYKLCSNFMALLHRAAKNALLGSSQRLKFSEAAREWNEFNSTISLPQNNPSQDVQEYSGLRKFHTRKVSAETHTKTAGLGLDLGIDVKSSNVPFSIQKNDRIRDFLKDDDHIPARGSKNILEEFRQLSVDSPEYTDPDDEETLVNSKTPQSVLKDSTPQLNSKPSFTGLMDLGSPFVMQYGRPLLEERSSTPSRIPIIRPNYHLLNVKEIAKKSGPTKIPSISPNHQVFLHSPERDTMISRPQLGHFRQSSRSTIAFPSPTPLRSELESTKILPKARLTLKSTPNLSYSSPSYSSPRNLKSTDSRADEVIWHQPVQTPKPRWK
ncbi:hypothetical protein PGUG_05002 [Meyerozyma guilliermondii ATCC 6260]|uniref:Karyogamy protein n=1 Tax=Meyerozyma guilliermondii (strain ATCC 6260 / CBS 566 / DSM 6381 / JCM 1539 / NBRC 10279 / NRRL Y-324) TaxID=294746 RepID=A5DP01_PICGU|nr:uncharacterized protein PGUG_05002 [Meyerozyma guilliermondii ATCC 6260]EDK40905.2 hypothetical protein PGUG_05002 [Meyerozyma guilliermondii ATCC 6260]